MKRFIFILVILTGLCFSQTIEVVKTKQILDNDVQRFAHPKFGPQGDKILVSSSKYNGLWIYEIEARKLRNLNHKDGAGYKARFSDDGKQILFRYNTYKNRRKLSTLAIQNIEQQEIQPLIKNKRNLYPPHYFNKHNIMYNYQGSKQVYDLDNNQVRKIATLSKAVSSEPLAYTENSNLIVVRNGQERILKPLGEGHYIWGSISPEKERILFTLAGKGTYISDLEGNIIAELGHANAPRWSPDGNWIVCMQDQDDGHRITASEITVISADGQQKYQLTDTKDKIELHPDWAPAGDKLVYNTIDGKIEIIQIKINK